MANYANFLKKLQLFGVVFGSKGRKLTGIQDNANKVTDTITFTAPGTLTFTSQIPAFLKRGMYFRVTAGGGGNQTILFKVLAVAGLLLYVDTAFQTVVPSAAGLTTLDARIAVVQNNPMISRLNTEGNTIFNAANGASTPGVLPCDIGSIMAEHYHDDGGIVPDGVYEVAFGFGDWLSSDAGDTYSIDITHGLNAAFPAVTVFEGSEVVALHRIRITDVNNIRISVSNHGADARFAGLARIEKT